MSTSRIRSVEEALGHRCFINPSNQQSRAKAYTLLTSIMIHWDGSEEPGHSPPSTTSTYWWQNGFKMGTSGPLRLGLRAKEEISLEICITPCISHVTYEASPTAV